MVSDAPKAITPRSRRTQAALLAAARKIFERDGFLAARITDIANEAGVAHGTFYTHFENKEAIFGAIVTELQREFLGETERLTAGPGKVPTPMDRIRHANRQYFETYARNRALATTWEDMAPHNPEMARLLEEQSVTFVERAERSIRTWQRQGLADRRIKPRYAARALTGMVRRFAYSLTSDDKLDVDTAVEQVSILWANALGLRSSADDER